MSLFEYIQKYNESISNFDGIILSNLLRKNGLHRFQNKNTITIGIEGALEKKFPIDSYCNGQAPQPYNEMLCEHFKGLLALRSRNYTESYTHQANLMQLFMRQFQSDNTVWLLPVLNVLSHDLRTSAKLADVELRRKGQKECKLEDAACLLRSCFSYCNRDSNPSLKLSKKSGTIFVINHLFRIYFQVQYRFRHPSYCSTSLNMLFYS